MEIITEKDEWNRVLTRFSNFNDVYFHYEYFKLFANHYNAKPEGLVWEDQHVCIFWSHLIRGIPNTLNDTHNYFDLITPYGYGGPLIHYKNDDISKRTKSLQLFMRDYYHFAKENNYISEFIRFHPVLKNWETFSEGFENHISLHYNNDTVLIDLRNDLDKIWQGIRKGHKYNIKKTKRENCEVKISENPLESDIDEFISLYYDTMKNNCASDKYFFAPSFIKDHFSSLFSVLVEVNCSEQLMGASMFIAGNSIVNYHLSGSKKNIKGVYPSETIIWNAIKWAKNNDFTYLHLGGGFGESDSLFNFKKGFSNTITPYYTGRIIFDDAKYREFSQFCTFNNAENTFFPAYRYGQSHTII
ncbi:peptidoglycan bridge formation glycyltransferase FemA/FemB family protein [Methanocalculus natronophilus]|uniref:peptidoglycan bridge formation glycyltransferase FemA/FemB family protein n=1 Tax=Methanocalculus natronophilus TaxID=1262400 RepID=UPI0031B6155A